MIGLEPESWERVMRAVEREVPLTDQRVVDQLQTITMRLGQLREETEGPALLIGPVEAHLTTLANFVRVMQPPSSTYRQLCSLLGETAALAGWLRWNMGQHDHAEHMFDSGRLAAEAAGDSALRAYLLGCLASRPFSLEDPGRRLDILSSAQGASPRTTAWLHVLAAGAHALQGQQGHFDLAIDEAREALHWPEDDQVRRPRVPFFDQVYLVEEAAAGLLRLNQPASAFSDLESIADEATGRMGMWVHLDMALAAADQGMPEEATRLALGVLEVARTAQVRPILRSLQRLPRRPSMQGCRERVLLGEALALA